MRNNFKISKSFFFSDVDGLSLKDSAFIYNFFCEVAFFIAVLTEAEVVVGLWCNRKLARSFYCFSTKIRSSATYPLKSKLR